MLRLVVINVAMAISAAMMIYCQYVKPQDADNLARFRAITDLLFKKPPHKIVRPHC